MEWTGERFTPGSVEGEIEDEHWHRYALARLLIQGKDALDIASGEGYGTHYLAGSAKSIVGVDISAQAVEFAAKKYQKPNLRYVQGSCSSIPLPDRSVDIVTSFETIEHHDQHDEMMAEIRRVLKPGGLLVISCPDKKNYTDLANHHNEFHVKELYREEFEALLKKSFSRFSIYGQKLVNGSFICNDSRDNHEPPSSDLAVFNTAPCGPEKFSWLENSVYLLAIASDAPIPPLPTSVLDSEATAKRRIRETEHYKSVIQGFEHHNRLLMERKNELEETLKEMREKLAQIQGSRSWKLSQAIRKAGRLLKL